MIINMYGAQTGYGGGGGDTQIFLMGMLQKHYGTAKKKRPN